MNYRPPRDLDPQISKLIRHKVNKLVGHYGFRRHDAEDLRQELTLHVVVGMQHYDASRASAHTYADRIVTSKIATIVEHATAQKRDRRRERHLGDEEEALPARPLATKDRGLALDVQEAVAQLPADLLPYAKLFMNYSEADVVRRTGMPRQRVRTIRARIGQHLRRRGLGSERASSRPTRRRRVPVDEQVSDRCAA